MVFAIAMRRESHRQALHAMRSMMLFSQPLPGSNLILEEIRYLYKQKEPVQNE